MPFDSNGIWSLTAGYLGVTGQTILPSNHNPPLEDIRDNGLSAVLVRDGRAPMTGPLNMGTTNKIVNLAAGSAPTDAVNKTQLDDAAATASVAGQCRLSVSGANLLLSRFNGRYLTINGTPQSIPSAGVTLAPSGLTPSTLYYIYAYMNSGTMTLEASTTVPVADTTTGIQIKTGDATRTLVGMARPVTGPAFVNSNSQKFVRSWFNEPSVNLYNQFTANRTTTSGTPTELNSEIRCEVLIWSGETVSATASGSVNNNTSVGRNQSNIAFDSTTANETTGSLAILGSATDTVPFSAQALKSGLSQGYHYITLLGSVNSGTGTWLSDTDGRRTSIIARISQ